MEQIRLTGSTVVTAEVVDIYKGESGKSYGTAIIEGERVPVLKYCEQDEYWYMDVGEIVR